MSSNPLGKREPQAKKGKPAAKKVNTGGGASEPVPKNKKQQEDYSDDGGESSHSNDSQNQHEDNSLQESEGEQGSNRRGGARGENSLGALTKEFIELLLRESGDDGLDLKLAADRLKVQKRRIYDITNVLEGTKFLKKVSKSRVKWVPRNEPETMEQEKAKLDAETTKLETQEQDLDQEIKNQQKAILDLLNSDDGKKYAYLLLEDLKTWAPEAVGGTESFFVVSASNGSKIEVTDQPAEPGAPADMPYSVQFSVPSGEIQVHLIERKNPEMQEPPK